jgi:hypothetical protein
MSTPSSKRHRLLGLRKGPESPRNQLHQYGFRRTRDARRRAWIVIVMTGIIAFAAGAVLGDFPSLHQSEANIITAIIGLGALVLGFQQWCAARNEISLDKFYERLEVTNRRLDEHEEVRVFAGPWCKVESSQDQLDEDAIYHRTMYAYRELDNLEYAIAKYELGYMSSENAFRSLRTFKARCNSSQEFYKLAWECVRANAGYDPITQEVVRKVYKEYSAIWDIRVESNSSNNFVTNNNSKVIN